MGYGPLASTASWHTRCDPAQNMQRFYRLSVQPGLFGGFALVREWDRIGSGGQMNTDWFDSEADAKDARFSTC
nr:WGR domain-containing protein [Maliponia aquimaris]